MDSPRTLTVLSLCTNGYNNLGILKLPLALVTSIDIRNDNTSKINKQNYNNEIQNKTCHQDDEAEWKDNERKTISIVFF